MGYPTVEIPFDVLKSVCSWHPRKGICVDELLYEVYIRAKGRPECNAINCPLVDEFKVGSENANESHGYTIVKR